MKWLGNFGRFWYDFVVGDDWTTAPCVIAVGLLTWGAARVRIAAWPVMVIGTTAILVVSVLRARAKVRERG